MTDTVMIPKKPRRRKSTSFRRMLVSLIAIVAVVAILGVTFGIVYRYTSRTLFRDGDDKYYIVQRDGVYVMVDEDGKLLDMDDEGNYYKTANGTLVTVDVETGEYVIVAAVLPADGEELQFSKYNGSFDVLMYPMIERSEIASIHVVNVKIEVDKETEEEVRTPREFTFVYDAEKQDFVIKGYEYYEYDETMFSSLAVATRYTSTYMRLDIAKAYEKNADGSYKYEKYQGFREHGYAEYGLPENPDAAEVYFEITTKSGETHKVILGDKNPSGTGYYARHADRDEVYILKETDTTTYSTSFSTVLIDSGAEDYIKPLAVLPMTTTNYFDVINFSLDQLGEITDEMLETMTPEQISAGMLQNVIAFSYTPIEQRRGTINASIPYTGDGKYEAFPLNSVNVDDCLQNMRDLTGTRVERIFGADEKGEYLFFRDYKVAYSISYDAVQGRDENYEPIEDQTYHQHIWISEITADGTYYVYNDFYGMVVEVDRSHLEFLEWTELNWLERDIFLGGNIAYLQQMTCTVPSYAEYGVASENTVFTFDNSTSLENWDPTNTQTSIPTDAMRVYANGTPVDVKQVKSYYRMLLFSSLGGVVEKEVKEEDMTLAFRISFTYTTKPDGGETFVRSYSFYDYGDDTKCFVTLNGVGNFWMSRDRVEKMMQDLGYVFDGTEIVPGGI